jgi:hypothetical protein
VLFKTIDKKLVNKVQFTRRTSHVPNLIRSKKEPPYYFVSNAFETNLKSLVDLYHAAAILVGNKTLPGKPHAEERQNEY